MNGADLAPTPSHIIGPTWQKTKEGYYYLPEKSLGWGLLNFTQKYILQPSGPDAGQPFLPTDEQARFLVWWYAVNDEGRFVYRSGLLRRMKGWGKDPLAALISLCEMCGPVQFDHWGSNGQPVGKRRSAAWIQIAAVSQDQTGNTMKLFPAMISEQLKTDFSLDINKTIIYGSNGTLIEAVTSSPLSMEGKRPTFILENETQWWLENNEGHAMAGVASGNATKAAYGQCRVLQICNAHVPGLESVAEREWDAHVQVSSGQAIDTGLLYDSIEAPPDTPVSEIPSFVEDPQAHENGVKRLRSGLIVARGDAVWLDIDTIIASILDIREPISESRRKFLNQVNAPEDAWITPMQWDQCQQDVELLPKDRIALGFDGSKSGDHTALVACRIEDGALFLIRHWNPEMYRTGEIPREDVDAVVRWAFSRYDVVAMRADVKEFESYVDSWGRDFKKKMLVNASPSSPIAYDMRANQKHFALDCERFVDAVMEQELVHDGDKLVRSHITNSVRHPTNWDSITIRKASKDSSRKIDAAVCSVLAYGARQDFLMSKKNRSRKAVVLK